VHIGWNVTVENGTVLSQKIKLSNPTSGYNPKKNRKQGLEEVFVYLCSK
jgi:hypothetical protein